MKHIILDQRYELDALLTTKISRKEIAAKLGISQNALSREVSRNVSPAGTYNAKQAGLLSEKKAWEVTSLMTR